MKKLELEGKRFGKLVVLKRDNTYKGRTKWLCKCDCGRIESKFGSSLVRGRCVNCGFHRENNLIGKKFGRLSPLKRVSNRGKATCWLCKCDCGKEKIVRGGDLLSGATQSCGCLNNERIYKHNHSRDEMYKRWISIKQRCFNPNEPNYKNYGGRGIVMCDEWKNNFMSFYNWAYENGYRKDLTIDRIDVNGNYEPSNCRWATNSEQANNKRTNHFIEYNGEIHTVTEWSKILDISYNKMRYHISKGEDFACFVRKEQKNEYTT